MRALPSITMKLQIFVALLFITLTSPKSVSAAPFIEAPQSLFMAYLSALSLSIFLSAFTRQCSIPMHMEKEFFPPQSKINHIVFH